MIIALRRAKSPTAGIHFRFVFFFLDRVLSCNFDWLGTCYLDQAGLQLLSAIKGMGYHPSLNPYFSPEHSLESRKSAVSAAVSSCPSYSLVFHFCLVLLLLFGWFWFWGRLSLCSPGWPQTCSSPASDFQVLGFQTWVTISSSLPSLMCVFILMVHNGIASCSRIYTFQRKEKEHVQKAC